MPAMSGSATRTFRRSRSIRPTASRPSLNASATHTKPCAIRVVAPSTCFFPPIPMLAPQLPQMHREAQEGARREMLDVLLDLRDRLAGGLERVRTSQEDSRRSRWTARLLARHRIFRQASENLEALEEGYQMCMERL